MRYEVVMRQTGTRLAKLEDIPLLALFERELARIAFPEDPIDDLEYHANRLRKSMRKEPDGMVVLVDSESGEVLAWMWAVTKTTLATAETYGVLRSIYVRPAARGANIGAMLAQYALRYFEGLGITRVVTKLHHTNLVGIRTVEKAGFEGMHLTLQWRAETED